MVSVRSIIKTSRLALSCRWLSSAIISVAALSIGLPSPRLLPPSKNVSRKSHDGNNFHVVTPGKRLGFNSIVAFCQLVTPVGLFVFVSIRNSCEDERGINDSRSCCQNTGCFFFFFYFFYYVFVVLPPPTVHLYQQRIKSFFLRPVTFRYFSSLHPLSMFPIFNRLPTFSSINPISFIPFIILGTERHCTLLWCFHLVLCGGEMCNLGYRSLHQYNMI